MFPLHPNPTTRVEQVRLATCLLHSIPGAVGTVVVRGRAHVVARGHRDAAIDPCGLRAALVGPPPPGADSPADLVDHVELTAGAVDIGGGLYERSHPAAGDERWFATTLPPERVREIAATCPTDLDGDDIEVCLQPDAGLGTCAVRLHSPRRGLRLDDVACWLHARCLVEELVDHAAGHG